MGKKRRKQQNYRERRAAMKAARPLVTEAEAGITLTTNALKAKDAEHDTVFDDVAAINASQNTSIGALTQRIESLETRMDNQEAVNKSQSTRITNVENDLAGHNHDGRYYGKGNTDSWFLRHNSHPLGTVQLHGNGYHSPNFQPL